MYIILADYFKIINATWFDILNVECAIHEHVAPLKSVDVVSSYLCRVLTVVLTIEGLVKLSRHVRVVLDEVVELAANAEVANQSDIFLGFFILTILQLLDFYDTLVNGALDKREIGIAVSCRTFGFSISTILV